MSKADPQYQTQYAQGQPHGQPHGHQQPPPYGQPQGQAIAMQPQGQQQGQVVQWMAAPGSVPGCPPGLEYLTMIDQLIVKQQIELFEVFTGIEMKNKYKVFNNVGQQVYFAQEESECCMRICCGPARGFTINITDNNGMEVMRFIREFKCCAGCCWCANSDCCAWVLSVEAPPGQPVGYVRQECSGWKPHFGLYTTDDQMLARIRGPCCVCNCPCCGDVEFPVLAPSNEQQIGKVAKQWTGLIHEWLTDADTFCVTFPMDMDVRMKATMMGALFLIDFMYFEHQQNNS